MDKYNVGKKKKRQGEGHCSRWDDEGRVRLNRLDVKKNGNAFIFKLGKKSIEEVQPYKHFIIPPGFIKSTEVNSYLQFKPLRFLQLPSEGSRAKEENNRMLSSVMWHHRLLRGGHNQFIWEGLNAFYARAEISPEGQISNFL